MELKEKFEATMISFLIDKNQDATMLEHFEKIADYYAIEFAEWCENKNVFSPSVIHKPTYNKLLIQFKKENENRL
jgi:hypothetical protein